MKYTRKTAKSHALAKFRGIWAAALTPFTADGAIDEAGYRRNIRHWIDDLGIAGFFVGGKQGEFFSMSIEERKRLFDIAIDECGDKAETIMSCSDQNMDVVIDLARHAQTAGADYIVVHAPVLHFLKAQDETLMGYYRTISEKVDIGMALWSHPDSGYLMSPDLCNRLADIETVVAIKYSVPRPMYAELSKRASDRILVSTASEDEWLDNIIELNWKLYLCSSPPYLYQTAGARLMHDYTQAAFAGDIGRARTIAAALEPVRHAFKTTRPAEKPHAHSKYWQDLLGQHGGHVRRPLLELDQTEKTAIKTAFDAVDFAKLA